MMKRTRLLFLLFMAALCHAQGVVSDIEQLTTHPQQDFDAALSPDGRWLAFVSERSGNRDIWVKPLPRGQAVQITRHKSEDTQPAWSPDSKALVFTSKRRDAFGDLWAVNLKSEKGTLRAKSEPIQLTFYLGPDDEPCFSSDGKQVVFTSNRSGEPNVWIVTLSSKEASPLTSRGGRSPAWSPKEDWIVFASERAHISDDLFLIQASNPETADQARGKVFPLTWGPEIDGQPAWSSDGHAIVFTRWQNDTDGDGVVTPLDHGVFIQKRLNESGPLDPKHIAINRDEDPVSTDYFNNEKPSWSGSQIAFTSGRGGGLDIWRMPADGLFPKATSAYEQYSLVLDRYGDVTDASDLHMANLGLEKVLIYFPYDSVWAARALLQMAHNDQFLNLDDEARDIYERVASDYTSRKEASATAILRLAYMENDDAVVREQRFQYVIDSSSDFPLLMAEAWVGLGDLYRDQGDLGKGLAAYGEALHYQTENDNVRAMIQMKLGDLLKQEGQLETARQQYLSVLRDFGHIALWRSRSLNQMMSLVEANQPNPVQSFRIMAQQASDMPDLQAQCRLRIAEILESENRDEAAIQELSQLDNETDLGWVKAEARLRLADLFVRTHDELKGILLLEESLVSLKEVEGGRYLPEIKNKLFEILFESAESLRLSGDWALAAARYQKALWITDRDVPCHRGLIECDYQRGQIQSRIETYKKQLEASPEDPVLLYGLGLSLSYAGDRNKDLLLASNDALYEALENDYRMIYPYRTLSYNYELLERLEEVEEARQHPLWVRCVRGLTKPLEWVFQKFVPKEDIKKQYYEKAIDVLTTAIELNDETQDPDMEALLLQNLANNFYHLGEYGYRKAFTYYQQRLALDTTFTSPLAEAVFYGRAGHAGVIINEYEQAEPFLEKAIAIYSVLGRDAEVLQNQRMLAFSYYLSGNHEQAVDMYEAVAGKEREAKAWEDLERSYRMLAFNFYLMGEPEDCLKYAELAENLLDKNITPKKVERKDALRIDLFGYDIPIWRMEDIGGASSEGFSSEDERALIYRLESRSYEILKDYSQAIAYEEKRLALFKQDDNKLGQRVTLSQLGQLYYKIGQLETAWDYFNQSRRACQSAKDVRGFWVNTLNCANVVHAQIEQDGLSAHLDNMIKQLEQIPKNEEVQAQLSRKDQLILSNHQGLFLLSKISKVPSSGKTIAATIEASVQRMDSLSHAQAYFETALVIAEERHDLKAQGILLKNLAAVAEKNQDNGAAYSLLKESWNRLYQNGEDAFLWRIEYRLALITQKLLEADPAYPVDKSSLQYFNQAMDRLEALPVDEESGDELLSDRTDRTALFYDAALAFATAGKHALALEALERARQKELSDLIVRKPPMLRWERHKIAWGNLRFLRSRLHDLRLAYTEEQLNRRRQLVLRKIDKDIQKYTREYQDILEEIQSEDPVLAYLTGSLEIRLKSFQFALDENTGLLSYLVHRDQLVTWYVDRDQVTSFVQPYDTLVSGAQDPVLYHAFLKPTETLWQSKSHLVIVPQGALWDIPFETLKSDADTRLWDQAAVSYSPSVMAYGLARDRKKINQSVFGVIGTEQDSLYLHSRNQFSQSVTRLGSKANRYQFQTLAGSVDVLQIERPFVQHRDLMTSSFIMAIDSTGHSLLPVHDLFSWQMKPSLLLLSTSQSGKDWRSIELFYYCCLYGGAPTLLVLRKNLPLPVKSYFMSHFYESLNQVSALRALEIAEKSTWQQYPEWQDHPLYLLMGFPGMGAGERLQYARENMVQTILLGRAIEKKGEYADAITRYEHAEVMAQTLGDSVSQQKIANEIIRAAYQGQLWQTAIAYQKQLLDTGTKQNDRESIKRSLKNLVAFSVKAGNFEEASAFKKQYLALLIGAGDQQAVAEAYEDLAFIYTADRQYDRAIEGADEAYAIYANLGNLAGQARALVRKGRFYLEGESYWDAMHSLEKGVALLDSARNTPNWQESLDVEYASALQLLGLAFEHLTRYDTALEIQHRAFDQLETLGNERLLAQSRQYIANIYWKMGKYREALQTQTEALQAFQSLNDGKGLAMAYSTQGLVYLSLGEAQKALQAEKKALVLAQGEGYQADQAAILKNMGLIYIQQNADDVAYSYFVQAAHIDSSLGLQKGLAYDYRNMGILLTRLGKTETSVPLLKRAAALSSQLQDYRNLIHSYYGLGQAYLSSGETPRALASVDSGLTLARSLVVPELMWRLERLRGQGLLAMNAQTEAVAAYENAIQVVEQMREELKVEGFQQGFLDSKIQLYEEMVAILMEMGDSGQAFQYVERAKSRSFIDMLANRDLVLPQLQGNQLERLQQAKLAVEEAQGALGQLVYQQGQLAPDAFIQLKSKLEDELAQLREQYQSLVDGIQSSNAELASFVSVQPLSVQDIRALMRRDTGLLQYFVTSDAIYFWLITPPGVYSKSISVPRQELTDQIRRFRQGIQAYLSVETESQQLYQLLFAQVAQRLSSDIRHLIIVPHGPLHYVPFAALQDEKGQALLEKVSLSIVPSSTVLRYCLGKGDKWLTKPVEHVLALGNPDRGGPEWELPFAEKEIVALSRSWPSVTSFLGKDATESVLWQEAPAADMIHLACHGVYEPENPLFSALLLTPDQTRDGRLEAHEIFGLNLDCRLVSLSACETGVSYITQGDEIVGLARGFLFAGTPSVITSLWKVDDLATAVLMKRFYRYLSQGDSRALALQKAQLLVKHSVNSHPAAWAAFTLTGDFR